LVNAYHVAEGILMLSGLTVCEKVLLSSFLFGEFLLRHSFRLFTFADLHSLLGIFGIPFTVVSNPSRFFDWSRQLLHSCI
jgi:hypothetical protein